MMCKEHDLLEFLIETQLEKGVLTPLFVCEEKMGGVMKVFVKAPETDEPNAKKICQQTTPQQIKIEQPQVDGKSRKALNFIDQDDNKTDEGGLVQQMSHCSPFKPKRVGSKRADEPNGLFLFNDNKMSPRILVEGLPVTVEDFFVFTIDDMLHFKFADHKSNILWTEYNKADNSAVLHFTSPKEAQMASELSVYLDGMPEGETLKLTHVPEEQEKALPKTMLQVSTAEVFVSGTPFPFFETMFVDMLKINMKEGGLSDSDFALCFDIDPDSSSVVIEFVSPDVATKFCNILKPFKLRRISHHFSQRTLTCNDRGQKRSIEA